MKKIALVALGSLTLLAGCAKPVTEVRAGQTPLQTGQTIMAGAGSAALQSDLQLIQQLAQTQQPDIEQLQQRMSVAMQQQDKAALAQLLGEFRGFVERNNQMLAALPLQTADAQALRQAMIENSLISLKMSDVMLKGDLQHPDMAALAPLQQQALQSQQHMDTLVQKIGLQLTSTRS